MKSIIGPCLVPTEDNPADMATRGKTPTELSISIWWKGPYWLQSHETDWPDWKPPVPSGDFDADYIGNRVLFDSHGRRLHPRETRQITHWKSYQGG